MGEQHERILAAATEVFAESGFAGARVDAIARRAGLNKRLLYHYVGDKAALLEAVLKQAAAVISEAALEDRRFWRLLLAEQEQLGHGPLGRALLSLVAAESDGPRLGGRPTLGARMFACLLPALAAELAGGADATAQKGSAASPSGAPDAAKPRLRLAPQVLGAPVRSRSKRSK